MTPPTDEELIAAARAVVERWDTPHWKDVPATAVFINRLRNALCDRLDGRGGGEVVAWRWRNPGGVWNYQEDRQRIAKAEHQPLYAGPALSREGEGWRGADHV